MIGLSVSGCISSMARGEVDPLKVKKIISGTRAENECDWEQIIYRYKQTHWRLFPEVAENLIRRFLAEGRIEQPRLQEMWRYPRHDGKKVFVQSESEIVWRE